MRVEIVADAATIEWLVPEWAALWRETAGAAPFQHPGWMMAWWAAFGTGRPLVATVRETVGREAGRLVGLYPAYVLVGERVKLLPMGAGTTDYLDALGAGAEAMLGALMARAALEGVEEVALLEVPPGSALAGFAGWDGWMGGWSTVGTCPVLMLAEVSAGMRRKLRMNRNRADRVGGWTVEDAGPDGLGVLLALHRARWEGVGEEGVLADRAVVQCLEAATRALSAAGLLRLVVLRVGGVVAAAVMALLGAGRIFFYASGYDAGQAFVSPGTLLVGAMLEQAIEEGREEAHFLRGREGYKYAWGAKDRMNLQGDFRRLETRKACLL